MLKTLRAAAFCLSWLSFAGTDAHSSSTAHTKVGDITGTVNADGTLTVNNPMTVAVTRAMDDTGTPVASTVTVDRSTLNQEVWQINTLDSAVLNDLTLTINNVTVDVDLTNGLAGYADTTAGMKAALEATLADLQADGKLAGLTFAVTTGDYDTTTGEDDPNDLKLTISKTSDQLAAAVSDVAATAGQSSSALDITTSSAASTSIAAIDDAIKALNNQRASLGSISNRLDSTVSNLTNISSNLQAGRGRIEDADFAAETTSLAKSQILQQASTAMLAQANASKQNVLSLLQG